MVSLVKWEKRGHRLCWLVAAVVISAWGQDVGFEALEDKQLKMRYLYKNQGKKLRPKEALFRKKGGHDYKYSKSLKVIRGICEPLYANALETLNKHFLSFRIKTIHIISCFII